jgi:hypothetical protein
MNPKDTLQRLLDELSEMQGRSQAYYEKTLRIDNPTVLSYFEGKVEAYGACIARIRLALETLEGKR